MTTASNVRLRDDTIGSTVVMVDGVHFLKLMLPLVPSVISEPGVFFFLSFVANQNRAQSTEAPLYHLPGLLAMDE